MIVTGQQYAEWLENEFQELEAEANKIGYSWDFALDYGYDEEIDTENFVRGSNAGIDIGLAATSDDTLPSINITPIFDDSEYPSIILTVELGFPSSLNAADYPYADSLHSILNDWANKVGKFTEHVMKFDAKIQYLEDFVQGE